MKDESSLAGLGDFASDAILLDAYCPGEYGGAGEVFDWNLARKVVDEHSGKRIILAGGLNPENVAEALDAVGPVAVDIASGVELSPGKKDLMKVRQVVERVRAYG